MSSYQAIPEVLANRDGERPQMTIWVPRGLPFGILMSSIHPSIPPPPHYPPACNLVQRMWQMHTTIETFKDAICFVWVPHAW